MTDASYSTDRDRVVERWQDGSFTADLSQIHWMASPIVRQYLNRRASGDPNCDWLTWMLGRYISHRSHRVLVLGCGDGWLERAIAHHWWIERIDAFDVAAGAVERAAAEATRLGFDKIHYGVRDLNRETLPEGPYELIIAHSVIHHIENLELFYGELHRVLADDGLLLVNEYVGPKRFQFTDRQMDVMNGLFTSLPARYHHGMLCGNDYPRKERPSVEEMIATDPSEAVRSDEILGFLGRNFEVLDTIDYGGTLLHHLLYDVVQNFSMETAADRAMVELLCVVEELLIVKSGMFSDFQIIAAAKRRLEPTAIIHIDPLADDTPCPPDPFEPLARLARWLLPRPVATGSVMARSRPAREEHSRQLTGDGSADWVQWVLASTGKPDLSVQIVARYGDDLARRLATDRVVRRVTLGPASAPNDKHDVVLGLGDAQDAAELAALFGAVAPGGTVAWIGRVAAPRPPQWLVRVVDKLIEVMPARWHRSPGLPSRLRRALALCGQEGVSADAAVAVMARHATTVEAHPISSQLTELLLSGCTLPAEPADESEDGLLRLLVASEVQLLRTRTVSPTIVLFIARNCSGG